MNKSLFRPLEERIGLPNFCGAISCARFMIIRNDEVKDLRESLQEDSILLKLRWIRLREFSMLWPSFVMIRITQEY